MTDRRDDRRRRARELREGGASYSEIAEALGCSKATALRDLRATGGEISSGPPDPLKPAADTGGGFDWNDYQAVSGEYGRVYARLAAGDRVATAQVRLIEKRYVELSRQEDVCATHISEADYITEVHWRDGVWVGQLQVALRRLTQSGAEGAEDILNEMLERVSALTAVGRPQNRS